MEPSLREEQTRLLNNLSKQIDARLLEGKIFVVDPPLFDDLGDPVPPELWVCFTPTQSNRNSFHETLSQILALQQEKVDALVDQFTRVLQWEEYDDEEQNDFFALNPNIAPQNFCGTKLRGNSIPLTIANESKILLSNLTFHMQTHNHPTDFDSHFKCDENRPSRRSEFSRGTINIPAASLCLNCVVRSPNNASTPLVHQSINIPVYSWGLCEVPEKHYIHYLVRSPLSQISVDIRQNWIIDDRLEIFTDEGIWVPAQVKKVFAEQPDMITIQFAGDSVRLRNVPRGSHRVRPLKEEFPELSFKERIRRVRSRSRARSNVPAKKPKPVKEEEKIVVAKPIRNLREKATAIKQRLHARTSHRSFQEEKHRDDDDAKQDSIFLTKNPTSSSSSINLMKENSSFHLLHKQAEDDLGREILLCHFKTPRKQFDRDRQAKISKIASPDQLEEDQMSRALRVCEFHIDEMIPFPNTPTLVKCRMISFGVSDQPFTQELYLTKQQIFECTDTYMEDWDPSVKIPSVPDEQKIREEEANDKWEEEDERGHPVRVRTSHRYGNDTHESSFEVLGGRHYERIDDRDDEKRSFERQKFPKPIPVRPKVFSQKKVNLTADFPFGDFDDDEEEVVAELPRERIHLNMMCFLGGSIGFMMLFLLMAVFLYEPPVVVEKVSNWYPMEWDRMCLRWVGMKKRDVLVEPFWYPRMEWKKMCLNQFDDRKKKFPIIQPGEMYPKCWKMNVGTFCGLEYWDDGRNLTIVWYGLEKTCPVGIVVVEKKVDDVPTSDPTDKPSSAPEKDVVLPWYKVLWNGAKKLGMAFVAKVYEKGSNGWKMWNCWKNEVWKSWKAIGSGWFDCYKRG